MYFYMYIRKHYQIEYQYLYHYKIVVSARHYPVNETQNLFYFQLTILERSNMSELVVK